MQKYTYIKHTHTHTTINISTSTYLLEVITASLSTQENSAQTIVSYTKHN